MRRLSTPKLFLALAGFAGLSLAAPTANAQVLFDNGPYYNSTGTGSGGANESVLYTTTFGMGTIGFGHQSVNFNRVADDFDISNCHWRIDSIAFFGYQTNSGTTSTFTAVNLRIWSDVPDQVGSSVVFGDTVTNRLIATRWSGAYRITETTTGNTARPIMRNVVNVGGLVLSGGNYWLDWSSAGGLASGPWAPPRTPVGVSVTGNGRQRVGSTWNNLVDGGTGTPAQGLPFIIYGTILDPTADAGVNQSVCLGNSVTLGGSPTSTGGYGPVSYAWSPGSGLNDSLTANPVSTPVANTTYILTVTDSSGCAVMDTVGIALGANSANFLPGDTTLCDGSTVTLDPGSGGTYLWSTGATSQTINVGPGTYYVDVDFGTGCNSTDTVVVGAQQHVTIAGNTTICENPGDTLCAQGNFATYTWSVGATTACITVTASGPYEVTTTDAYGCVSVDTFTVVAIPSPSASFAFTSSGNGLAYSFTDGSSNATSWSWNFGDNGTSTQQNPSHTYAASGNYTVTLIVSNSCGSDTSVMNIGVVAIDGQLDASISVSPQPAQDFLRYQVTGLQAGDLTVELTDIQGRVINRWNHADGTTNVDARVDVSEIAKGLYFLNFRQGEYSTIKKVVIE